MLKSRLKENKKANCFQCQEEVIVKYNYPRKDYSLINNWGYWTERKENNNKYICNSCLKKPTQKQTAVAFGVTDRTIRNWDKRRRLNKSHLEIGRKGIIKDPKLQTSLRRYSSFLKQGILSTQ